MRFLTALGAPLMGNVQNFSDFADLWASEGECWFHKCWQTFPKRGIPVRPNCSFSDECTGIAIFSQTPTVVRDFLARALHIEPDQVEPEAKVLCM